MKNLSTKKMDRVQIIMLIECFILFILGFTLIIMPENITVSYTVGILFIVIMFVEMFFIAFPERFIKPFVKWIHICDKYNS